MAIKFTDRYLTFNENNALIVDALNLAFRWKHGNLYNSYSEEFHRTVGSFANSYKSKKVIIACDWGASSYRKELYPEYKSDRKDRFKDQTEEEKLRFEQFFQEFEKSLILLSKDYTLLRYKNVEADDIAAHLVNNKTKYELDNIWLLSSDRDWSLLVEEGVNQFSWRTRKEITVDTWSEHYEVSRDEYISYKCLMGDSGDNIPGISGIGPKRAEFLIKQYGSALDIYDLLPINSKYKYIKELNENGEQLLLNYQLMDLRTYCDDAIGKDNLQDIRLKMGDVPW